MSLFWVFTDVLLFLFVSKATTSAPQHYYTISPHPLKFFRTVFGLWKQIKHSLFEG